MNPLCEKCKGACCETWAVLSPADPDEAQLIATRSLASSGGITCLDCRCRHLTEGGRCGIYADRPKLCVEFEPGGFPCLMVLKNLRPELYEEVVAGKI